MDIKKIILEEMDDLQWIKDEPMWEPIYSCDNLSIGDRVKVTSGGYFVGFMDDVGTVVGFNYNNPDNELYLVDFDERFSDELHGGDRDTSSKNHHYFKCSRLNTPPEGVAIGGDKVFKQTFINESEEFDWIRDVKPGTPITKVKPNQYFNIIELSDKSLEEITNDNDLGYLVNDGTLFTETFRMDNNEAFEEDDTSRRYHDTEQLYNEFGGHKWGRPEDDDDLRVWLTTDELDGGGWWVSTKGMFVHVI